MTRSQLMESQARDFADRIARLETKGFWARVELPYVCVHCENESSFRMPNCANCERRVVNASVEPKDGETWVLHKQAYFQMLKKNADPAFRERMTKRAERKPR